MTTYQELANVGIGLARMVLFSAMLIVPGCQDREQTSDKGIAENGDTEAPIPGAEVIQTGDGEYLLYDGIGGDPDMLERSQITPVMEAEFWDKIEVTEAWSNDGYALRRIDTTFYLRDPNGILYLLQIPDVLAYLKAVEQVEWTGRGLMIKCSTWMPMGSSDDGELGGPLLYYHIYVDLREMKVTSLGPAI